MKKIVVLSVAALLLAAIVASAGYKWTAPGTDQIIARMISAGYTEEAIEEVLALDTESNKPARDGDTRRWSNDDYTYLTVREYHEGKSDKEFCFTETVIYNDQRKKR